VFGLIGLELPFVLKGISSFDVLPTALVLLGVVIVVRIVFVFGRNALLRLIRRRRRPPSWQVSAVLS